MNDGIRPIKVHPRTVEVMREIGMALTEMIIDENVPNDPQLAGVAVPKNLPGQEAYEVVSKTSSQWTWKQWDTATNAWHAKLETPNGVAHMDLMWPRGNAGVDIELRAWEQNWKQVIYDGGTIDQFMRMAEDWANKIIAYHGLTSSVTAKDVEQAWRADMECSICGSSEPHGPHDVVGTVAPGEKVVTVQAGGIPDDDLFKQLDSRIRQLEQENANLRKANQTLTQAAVTDEQLQRIGQLMIENSKLLDEVNELNRALSVLETSNDILRGRLRRIYEASNLFEEEAPKHG